MIKDSNNFLKYSDQLTVFDSTGWAIEDQIVMEMLFEYACEFDIGIDMQLHYLPKDPHNPYDFD